MSILANSSVIGGESSVDVGDIGHSLRFRGAQYLSRTITTDATSTYAFAVKRGKLGVISPIVETQIRFNANDTFTAFGLTTSAVYREPADWIFFHISNNGLYVNGVYIGAVTTSAIVNGRIGFDGTNYFDGYLARFCVVGGTVSSYTNFIYFNTEINEWVSKTQSQVKAVVDAGGTNSFMLDFDNGTSLTTLGYDKHGANLLTYSQDLTNGVWTKSNTGSVSISGTAPDSTATANLISDTGAGDAYIVYQGVNVPNDSQTYIHSVYIKAGTAPDSVIGATCQTGGTLVSNHVTLVWTGGVPSITNGTGSIESVGSGWYRLAVPVTNNSSGNTQTYLIIYPRTTVVSYTGSISVWGAQCERGDTASPYKVTTSVNKPHNDWTLNGHSLTLGSTYDWMLDVPGNSYATLNPLLPTTNHTYSNGNLTATLSSAADPRFVKGSMFVNTGKWYAEFQQTAGANVLSFGIGNPTAITSGGGLPQANSVIYFGNGVIYKNAVSQGTFTTYTSSNVIRVEYNADTLSCAFYKDSVLVTTITGVTSDSYTFGGFSNNSANSFAVNFGQQPNWNGTPTTGFKALCQANLPDGETITTSGTFTGNLAADGPYRDIKGSPLTMTINGNAVTWGTHADKTAFGFKVRSSSSSYNNTGSNTFSVTSSGPKRKYALGKGNP